jgi:hypothetical protein
MLDNLRVSKRSFVRRAALSFGLGMAAALAVGCGGNGGSPGDGSGRTSIPGTTGFVDCLDVCGNFILCGDEGITDPSKCSGQQKAFEWEVGATATGDAIVRGLGFDELERLIAAGTFHGTLDLGTVQLVSQGDQDIFVAKFAANGALLWAKALGGAGLDHFTGLAVAPDGTAFVARADPGLRLTSFGPDGEVLWEKSYDVQTAFAQGSVVTATGVSWLSREATGDLFLAATYEGTATLGGQAVTSAGYTDMLVTRLGPQGDPIWVKSLGGSKTDQVLAVAASSDGGVILGGAFFGSMAFGETTVTSTGDYDGFVAKLGGDGSPVFFTPVEGEHSQEVGAVAATSDGGAFVSGGFAFDAKFGTFSLTTPPNFGPYVGRVGETGNVIFAHAYEGPQDPPIRYRVATSASNLVLAGHYSGSKDIAWPGKAKGMNDVFVVEMGMLGEQGYNHTFGTFDEEEIWALATSPSGRVAVGGFYTSQPLDFDLEEVLPVGPAKALFVAVRSP